MYICKHQLCKNYLDYQTTSLNAFDIPLWCAPPLLMYSNQNQLYWNQR